MTTNEQRRLKLIELQASEGLAILADKCMQHRNSLYHKALEATDAYKAKSYLDTIKGIEFVFNQIQVQIQTLDYVIKQEENEQQQEEEI